MKTARKFGNYSKPAEFVRQQRFLLKTGDIMARKIRIYYRAPSHVPLWKVMEEGGFLEKHGLEMEMGSLEGQRKRAAEGLKAGELDIVRQPSQSLRAQGAPR